MDVQCASALSVHPVAAHATGEIAGAVLEALGPGADVAFLFATRHHTGALDDVVAAVRRLLAPTVLVGCTAENVAGGSHETDGEAGLSLLAVRFPPGTPPARAVRLEAGRPLAVHADAGADTTLVVLADPFSYPVPDLLDALAARGPSAPTVVGGLASAALGPGGNRLFLDDRVVADGAVGVLLPGEVATTALVSQGCRPIGEPMVVTAADGDLLEAVASEPALPALLRLIGTLPPDERSAAARGLQVGLVVDERKDRFGPGDFLIRAVLGSVAERQAVAIGDHAPVGTTVQFQVRDAATADEELRAVLSGRAAAGALLFTCAGRGTALFDGRHHDAALVAATTPAAGGGTLAGMSCAGEIGPVGGRSHLHGQTAVVLLLGDGAEAREIGSAGGPPHT